MTRRSRGRILDTRQLEHRLHAEHQRKVQVPPHHIIGRLATSSQARLDGTSPVGVYFRQEGLRLTSFEPFLADVSYRPFRTKTQQNNLDIRDVKNRIYKLGGVSARRVTVQRTSLRLSRLTLSREGLEAYLLLSYVDHALDKNGHDVTEQLYEHHDVLVTEFGDADYVDPVLHFGVVVGHRGIGASGWLEDYLPGELEGFVPERIGLPPVSLVELPRLPD